VDEIQQGYGTSLLPTLSKVLLVEDSLLSLQVHPCDETVARAVAGGLPTRQDLELNPTVRVTDFGRRAGDDPELGFSIARAGAGLRRMPSVEAALGPGMRVRILAACPHFVRARLNLARGTRCRLHPCHGSYRVLHCVRGRASVEARGRRLRVGPGETAFVPGELEAEAFVHAQGECQLLDDAVPDLEALASFLKEAGAPAEQVEALTACAG